MSRSRIRPARAGDVEQIFAMVCELAEYERSRDQVMSSPELFHDALFGDDPGVWCSIVEHHDADDATDDDPDWQVAGMAIWFRNFFTWTAKHLQGRSRWMSTNAPLSQRPQPCAGPWAPNSPALTR